MYLLVLDNGFCVSLAVCPIGRRQTQRTRVSWPKFTCSAIGPRRATLLRHSTGASRTWKSE